MFCGSIENSNDGDFIYGYLDSSFVLQRAYRYGSPGSEVIGDCALTSDNQYLIGLFSSNYYRPRTGTTINRTAEATITITSTVSEPIEHPCHHWNKPGFSSGFVYGINNLVRCKPYTGNDIASGVDFTSTSSDCAAAIEDNFEDYFLDYADVYSWTSCQHYTFELEDLECVITSATVTFSGCTGGFTTVCETFAGNTACD